MGDLMSSSPTRRTTNTAKTRAIGTIARDVLPYRYAQVSGRPRLPLRHPGPFT